MSFICGECRRSVVNEIYMKLTDVPIFQIKKKLADVPIVSICLLCIPMASDSA